MHGGRSTSESWAICSGLSPPLFLSYFLGPKSFAFFQPRKTHQPTFPCCSQKNWFTNKPVCWWWWCSWKLLLVLVPAPRHHSLNVPRLFFLCSCDCSPTLGLFSQGCLSSLSANKYLTHFPHICICILSSWFISWDKLIDGPVFGIWKPLETSNEHHIFYRQTFRAQKNVWHQTPFRALIYNVGLGVFHPRKPCEKTSYKEEKMGARWKFLGEMMPHHLLFRKHFLLFFPSALCN